MSRASLLCLVSLFSLIQFLGAIDDVTTIPVCEDKSPDDIYFDFSDMGWKELEKPFVSGSSVTCINLEGNQISNLQQETFDALPELRYLNLARNPLSFKNFMKMTFTKLSTLVLDGPFTNPDEEHKLSSSYYTDEDGDWNAERWENVFLISLPNLKKLSLRNFGVEDEEVSVWLEYVDVPNLTHLYLAGNDFADGDLPEKFTDNLTFLNMDDNNLQMFFTNFPNLRYLSMDRNNIQTVCNSYCDGYSLLLRDMPNLEYLSLMGNNIENIESGTFRNLDNLHVLNLAMNKLTSLPTDLFDDMTSLKNLSLAKNKFTEIPHICGLINLEVLILNGNNITSIDDASFCDLSHIVSIDLSHNQVTTISDGTFGLFRLLMLDLSWNNIASLSENWMGSEPVQLDVLNLEGNLFTDVTNISLERFTRLDTLIMGHNLIKTFTIRSIMNLPPDTNIDISRIAD